MDWKVAAIIDLYDDWAETDGSNRKLAHRGSRLGPVHVLESTAYRVLATQQLVVPDDRTRTPRPHRPWPEWVEYRPRQVWGHDFSAFMAAGTDALGAGRPGVTQARHPWPAPKSCRSRWSTPN